MAPKVTVLHVCLICNKCKVKLLKKVAGLEGVNKIETDENKGTLTVTGNVDPHDVMVCARKVGAAAYGSVSDPKKPDDEKPKPEPEPEPEPIYYRPCTKFGCPDYVVAPFDPPTYYPDQPTCSIM